MTTKNYNQRFEKLLTVFLLIFALVSCGDDGDDTPGGGTKRTPEQMLRQRWIISTTSTYDHYEKAYLDLTGSTAQIAFQYSQTVCNLLGLQTDTWYEGVGGEIEIVPGEEGGVQCLCLKVGGRLWYTFKVSEISENALGKYGKVATGSVSVQKLPFHDIVSTVVGRWKDNENAEFYDFWAIRGNLLFQRHKEFKWETPISIVDGKLVLTNHIYYTGGGVDVDVTGSVYSSVMFKTTGGTEMSFTVIDNKHMQWTINGKNHNLERMESLPVEIEE